MSTSGNLNTYIDLLKNSVNFSTGKINNLAMFIKVIDFLESYDMTYDDLKQRTEIGALNTIRKNIEDKTLAKRIKRLVRSWFEEKKGKPIAHNRLGLVNGDGRGIVPKSSANETISTHRTKHSNDHHTLSSSHTHSLPLQLKISIPRDAIRLNHMHTHQEQTEKLLLATPQPNNYKYHSQTQNIPNEHLFHSQIESTAKIKTEFQTQHPETSTDTSLATSQARENDIPSPLGATPPRPASPFSSKSLDGVSTQDGVIHSWEEAVVVEDSTLIISPYSSLFEWENQLTIRPML